MSNGISAKDVPLIRESNSDLFFAASVGLGALGIIVSVNLQVVEAFNLRGDYSLARFVL